MSADTLSNTIARGRKTLQSALQKYTPDAVFAGFSGGDDSLVATDFLHRMLPKRAQTVHINTGIGFETTREYVRSMSEEMGWRMEEIHAEEDCGESYDEIVRGNCKVPGGFPGPAAHQAHSEDSQADLGSYIYDRLKGRAIGELHRRHKDSRGGEILLITGIRKDESQRRMGYDDTVIDRDPAWQNVVWINPIYYLTADQRDRYIKRRGLRRNPATKICGTSGECLCGAFDEGGKALDELKAQCNLLGEMDLYERIVSLQEEVWDDYPWRYDERPPDWFAEAREGQMALEGIPRSEDQNRIAQQMCVGCGKSSNG
jgi:3'-phosphoadenosine 5'-phosphosulfate sulfotransferase (PAPS reductase)/FAD synthetase